ncbi:hypothetical protein [Erysipelothrix aquatica]|uniref:hypothetical protein n=1 Tax=Erysipelothrix aquatica TaxID=2683714 RepID=UPI00135702D5|nr:hypothetical protein [Erysipelothrix aquatica]
MSDIEKCKRCGCDWYHPCEGGCYWVDDELCSSCATEDELKMYEEIKQAHIDYFSSAIGLDRKNESKLNENISVSKLAHNKGE